PHYDHRAWIFPHLADASGVHLVAHKMEMAQLCDGVSHGVVDRALRFLATGQVDDGNGGDGCGNGSCERLRTVPHQQQRVAPVSFERTRDLVQRAGGIAAGMRRLADERQLLRDLKAISPDVSDEMPEPLL